MASVVALLGTVGSAAGGALAAGGAGLASAGGSLLSAVGGAGTIANVSGALGAFSAFAGGLAARKSSREQAYQQELESTQTQIQGKQESNDILDRLIDTQAKNQVAFRSAGVDQTRGSARDFVAETDEDGERSRTITRANTRSGILQRRRRARLLRRSGAFSLAQGTIQGLAQAGNTVAAAQNRNSP